MKLLPAIDLLGGRPVRLRQGDFDQVLRFGDDAVALARRFAATGAEWLHLVDLDGASTPTCVVMERWPALTWLVSEASGRSAFRSLSPAASPVWTMCAQCGTPAPRAPSSVARCSTARWTLTRLYARLASRPRSSWRPADARTAAS